MKIPTEHLIAQTEAYVVGLLEERLPAELYYHDLNHTREVVEAVREIAKAERVAKEDTDWLLVAAWFHDVGYVDQYIGHEEESCEYAAHFLKEHAVPDEKIALVKSLIMATKFRHEAKSKLETVLIDADRFAMGQAFFLERGENLRKEWGVYLSKFYSDKEWADIQVNYIMETEFLTHYCRVSYGKGRVANIKKLKEQSLVLEKEESSISAHSRYWAQQIKEWLGGIAGAVLLGVFIGITLSFTVWGATSFMFGIGAISGILIGAVLRIFDQPFEKQIIRRVSFPVAMGIGTLMLIALFLISQFGAVVVYDLITSEKRFSAVTETYIFKTIVSFDSLFNMFWMAFLMSIIINFVKLTSRIIGPRVLLNYLRGRYHKPIEEERIFMFIDLNSSTTLAEKMQTIQYHQLLNDFFYDIGSPISRSQGEIYQYVGDEVVITWKMKDGLKNSNCIRCFFRIEKQIKKLSREYHKKFGFIPDFKVALHGGKVITGEVGKNKTEIVFHGDVINTTERILNQCNLLGKKVLISEQLLKRLDLLPNIHAEYLSTMLFKGKENEVSIYSLRKDA